MKSHVISPFSQKRASRRVIATSLLAAFLGLPCEWPKPVVVREMISPEVFFPKTHASGFPEIEYVRWELPDDRLIESRNQTHRASYRQYRDRLREAGVSFDPVELIQRQQVFFGRWPELVDRMTQVARGALGTLRDARCVESLMLSEHVERYGIDTPSEFTLLLTRAPNDLIHVHALFWNESTGLAPPVSVIGSTLSQELKQGFIYESHLHFHPFRLGAKDIAGTPVPSGLGFDTDLGALWHEATQRGMRVGRITNGISTWEITRDELKQLRFRSKALEP